MEEKSNKSWLASLILCWFLGFFGIHRMYAGKVASGFLILYGTIAAIALTFVNIIYGLVALVVVGSFVAFDFVLICLKHFTDCRGAYITEDQLK